MYLYYWFILLAAAALIISAGLLHGMKRKKSLHLTPIVCVNVCSYLIAAVLTALTMIHGTSIQQRTLIDTLPIDPATFSYSVTEQPYYSFTCENGVSFSFDQSQLLDDSIDATAAVPDTVEIYSCEVLRGYDFCMLSQGTKNYYCFKKNLYEAQ